jgi:hypothetical protein
MCHARFPDEGDNVWLPDFRGYVIRSLCVAFREVRNEEGASTGDN